LNVIGTFINCFGDDIANVIDDVGVVSVTTIECVCTRTTVEGIIPRTTIEGVVTCVTCDDVVEVVTCPCDGCACEGQVFNVGGESVTNLSCYP
jgi:hypothetical protein